ncbi:MAG: response regulator [Bacteroidota bacterium]
MTPLRCLIVDDEPLARERMDLLLRESGANVVGSASNGTEALEQVAVLRPDVLFLDIEMPGLDGFDVVDLLDPETRPAIVFVTAFDAYAVRAFDVHAIDYLTKPVRPARLKTALDRLASSTQRARAAEQIEAMLDSELAPVEPPTPDTPSLDRLTLQAGRRLWVVATQDIARIEAESKTTMAYPFPGVTPGDRPGLVDFTLDALEARLDPRQFVRVHRSVLVNVRAVRELVPWFSGTYRVRLSDGADVPLARRRVAAVRALLGG